MILPTPVAAVTSPWGQILPVDLDITEAVGFLEVQEIPMLVLDSLEVPDFLEVPDTPAVEVFPEVNLVALAAEGSPEPPGSLDAARTSQVTTRGT